MLCEVGWWALLGIRNWMLCEVGWWWILHGGRHTLMRILHKVVFLPPHEHKTATTQDSNAS